MLRRAILCLVVLLSPLQGDTPPAGPEGLWEGTLKTGPLDLRFAFKITKEGDTLKATMDSLDQGAKGIPFSKVTFAEGKLTSVQFSTEAYKSKEQAYILQLKADACLAGLLPRESLESMADSFSTGERSLGLSV